MRNISEDLQSHLSSEVTTLCWLWKITRRDGRVLGFTDHDKPLFIDGVSYEMSSSLIPSETDNRLGFSADNGAVQGVFDSARITAADIKAGLYENAVIDSFRVNWKQPEQSIHMSTGRLGSIRQSGDTFEAEWTGQSVLLERSTGRVFSKLCDAAFGDERCGLNASDFAQGTTCPRSYEACQNQFDNILNFRGFPFLLGDDALQAAPQIGELRDGSSRYK